MRRGAQPAGYRCWKLNDKVEELNDKWGAQKQVPDELISSAEDPSEIVGG